MHRPIYRHTIFLALLACLLWSTAFAGIKIGLTYTTPLRFAGIRFIISGLMIFPFVPDKKRNFSILGQNIKTVLLISLFQTVILYTLFYLGMDRTPAAIGAIIVGGGPLFVAFLAHFTTGRDPLTLRKIVALLIGFSGIILLAAARDREAGDHMTVLLGIGLLVGGNFAGSYGNILVSTRRTNLSPVFLTAVQIFIGGCTIFLLSLLFEGFTSGHKPLAYYLSLGWLSMLSAVAFTLWFIILSRPEVKVSEVNIWKFIIPVFGAVLSWLLVKGEHPLWHTVAGMILIASSIVIINLRKKSTKS